TQCTRATREQISTICIKSINRFANLTSNLDSPLNFTLDYACFFSQTVLLTYIYLGRVYCYCSWKEGSLLFGNGKWTLAEARYCSESGPSLTAIVRKLDPRLY